MRYKINKFLSASFMACLVMSVLLFNACKTDEVDLSTVKLAAFGPSPALRGAEVKFIGTNMDKVTAVVLPGNMEITDISKNGTTEISIIIPQNATPGIIILKTPQGNIETKTPLTFSEPILIETYSPATVKAGDKFTINGDYLNLIAQVIFADGVVVDSADFVSQSRKKIEVNVPIEAQTGKVSVSNGAEIPILVYTTGSVQVTLPILTSMAPAPVKPGSSLQITGVDFQLVKSIVFTENITVENFTVNTEKTIITVTVPAMAKEGKVKLIAFSGVKIESGANLTLVGPSITAVAPNPVKNGATLTVTGTDLDLVTGATFTGVAGTISAQSATSLELTVPLTAKNGTVILSTNSGKTAESASVTYILPTITSIAPLALMAGGDITITGTDLDLVRSVKFVGGLSVTVTPVSATSFVVTVPPACVGSATVTLVTANGDEVVSTDVLAVEAANKPVITTITAVVKPGNKLTITGTKLNMVESIYFAGNLKAVLYGVRTETSIEVYVPQTAKSGLTTITLNAFDGAEVVSPQFTIAGTDPITENTKMVYDFNVRSTSDWHAVDWDNWGSSYDAATSKANGYITLVARPGWWVLGCNHPDPNGGWPSVDPSQYVLKVDIKTTTPIKITGGYEFIFKFGGEDIKSQLMVDGDYIATPNNDWATITMPISGILSNPTKSSGDFGIVLNYSDAGTDFSGLCFDNIRYEKITAPSGVFGLY